MMNRFFTLLLAASCLTAVGQVTYPYNPDGNADGDIAVGDLQDFLVTYGNPFSPSEILVDGETLTTVLTQLQNSIDSLSGLTGSGGSVLDMPLGTVLPIATESVPEGWMLCDGREISIEEYQGLYDLIGTTYGAGDSAFWAQVFFPATTFNIPDLRGRTIIGANDMGGEQSDVLTLHQASAGQIGGQELHQLTEDEMPSHSHIHTGNSDEIIFVLPDAPSAQVLDWPFPGSAESSPTGGDQPHNNMQPYMALNCVMKVRETEDAIAELEAKIQSAENVVDSLASQFDNAAVEFQVLKDCWELPRGPIATLSQLNDGLCNYPEVNEFVIASNSGCDVQSLEILFESDGNCYGSIHNPHIVVIDSLGNPLNVWFNGVYTDTPEMNLVNSSFWSLENSFPKSFTIYIPPGTAWSEVRFDWQFWGAPCGGGSCFSEFAMKCFRH